MTPIASALYDSLKTHRSERVRQYPQYSESRISRYTISYGELCRMAEVPIQPIGIGKYLGEVATHCNEHGFPPINALAVNGDSGLPGDSYDQAGDGLCSLANWPKELESCINEQRQYP